MTPRHRLLGRLVVAILVAHGALAWSASRYMSVTYDEVLHLPSGVVAWTTGDHRFNTESGLLVPRLASLPLVIAGEGPPDTSTPAFRAGRGYAVGREWLFAPGRDTAGALMLGRAAATLLSIALCATVFAWARALGGDLAGVIALVTCALCPTVLGHGGLVTTDVGATLALWLTLGATVALTRRVTVRRLAACAAAASMLVLAKMSWPLALPIVAVMAIARVVSGEALPVLGREARTRMARALVLLAAALLVAFVAWTSVWAAHGFRFAPTPGGENDDVSYSASWELVSEGSGTTGALAGALARRHVLPDAYLHGLAFTGKYVSGRNSFLDGRYSLTGFPSFFPRAFALKTPLGTIALLLIALVALLEQRRAGNGSPSSAGTTSRRRDLVLPLVLVALVYGGTAIASHVNIGYRHLLPVLPVLFITAGAAARWLAQPLATWRGALTRLAVVTLVAETALAWPHYIAFFNVAGGGSRDGWRHLVDSSHDWGQDLGALRTWLADRDRVHSPETPIAVSYFGTVLPPDYGFACDILPSRAEVHVSTPDGAPLMPGTYAISTTMLQGVYLRAWGRWDDAKETEYRRLVDAHATGRLARDELGAFEELRFARLCAYLRGREPDDRAGRSILIYELDARELSEAIEGPPPEIVHDWLR